MLGALCAEEQVLTACDKQSKEVDLRVCDRWVDQVKPTPAVPGDHVRKGAKKVGEGVPL